MQYFVKDSEYYELYHARRTRETYEFKYPYDFVPALQLDLFGCKFFFGVFGFCRVRFDRFFGGVVGFFFSRDFFFFR